MASPIGRVAGELTGGVGGALKRAGGRLFVNPNAFLERPLAKQMTLGSGARKNVKERQAQDYDPRELALISFEEERQRQLSERQREGMYR